MQPLRLLKSIDVENVDGRQTLLIFPVDFMRHFSPQHVAQFQELAFGELLVRLTAPGAQLFNRSYKLVSSHQATWTSIPRPWLRNIGARAGDKLDLYTTQDQDALLLKHRRAPIANP